MKESYFSIIAVTLLVIGIAVAGCTGTGPAPAPGGAAITRAPAVGGVVAPVSGPGLTGAAIAAGTPALSWSEYMMNASGLLIYIRYDTKNQSCTMQFKGDVPPGMPTAAICGAGGHKIYRNPNTISPDLAFADAGPSLVTVPAGTFAAEKYTTTADGAAATYWIAKGQPVLKLDTGDILGPMELDGWG